MDNKTFIARLSRMIGTEPQTTVDLVNCLANILKEKGAELDSVAIPGFGNFVAMKKPEHIVYDTDEGKRKLVPPQIKLEFVAGSKLKRQITAHE